MQFKISPTIKSPALNEKVSQKEYVLENEKCEMLLKALH